MPSTLHRVHRRYDAGGQRSRAEELAQSEGRALVLTTPWGGYAPDLSPAVADWKDFATLEGFMPRNGGIAPPTGFVQLDSANLPVESGTEPIVGLPLLGDVSTLPITIRRYLVTADATLGHLYELQGGGWTNIPYAGGGAGLSGDTSSPGVAQTLCDSTYFPLGDDLILANGLDPVYTHAPGGASYTDFSPAVLNPFIARSCESFAERVFFLNTNEVGTAFPNRLRGTTRSASPSLSGVGSVLISFDEIEGKGVAVRQLGNYLACYFSRGVALCRETGNLVIPLVREYISRQRGLIGTFAVADLGSGLHFGIFTDGWFMLDSNGTFREVGLRNVNGGIYPRWRTTFYRQLNTQTPERVTTAYDALRRGVWILWPDTSSTGAPNRLWFYHIETDSVWPLDNIFGSTLPNVVAANLSQEDHTFIYATATTTYATELRTYADFEQVEGEPTVAFGSLDGYVYQQEDRIVEVNGTTPTYSLQTHRSDFGAPDRVKTVERVDIGYRKQITASTVTITHYDEEGSSTQTVATRTDTNGDPDTDYVYNQRTGVTHALGFSGTHPLDLISIRPEVHDSGAQSRKLR